MLDELRALDVQIHQKLVDVDLAVARPSAQHQRLFLSFTRSRLLLVQFRPDVAAAVVVRVLLHGLAEERARPWRRSAGRRRRAPGAAVAAAHRRQQAGRGGWHDAARALGPSDGAALLQERRAAPKLCRVCVRSDGRPPPRRPRQSRGGRERWPRPTRAQRDGAAKLANDDVTNERSGGPRGLGTDGPCNGARWFSVRAGQRRRSNKLASIRSAAERAGARPRIPGDRPAAAGSSRRAPALGGLPPRLLLPDWIATTMGAICGKVETQGESRKEVEEDLRIDNRKRNSLIFAVIEWVSAVDGNNRVKDQEKLARSLRPNAKPS